jgi:hypothetical protein
MGTGWVQVEVSLIVSCDSSNCHAAVAGVIIFGKHVQKSQTIHGLCARLANMAGW